MKKSLSILTTKSGLLSTRKRKSRADDWLLTYGDMMTLLLCFFVILISISTINPDRYEMISESMSRALREFKAGSHVPAKTTLKNLKTEVKKIIREGNLENDIDVEATDRGILINAKGALLFASGEAKLQDKGKDFLSKLTSTIKDVEYSVEIEGHTDNVPISTKEFPSNWDLSSARASEVVRFFVEKGVPKDKLRATGFAETKPRAPNVTKDGTPIPENQALNRRVAILIMPF